VITTISWQKALENLPTDLIAPNIPTAKRTVQARLQLAIEKIDKKRGSPVERRSLGTVDIVPPVAGKLFLIEQSAIGAQESSTLMTFAPIMANVVRLKSHNSSEIIPNTPQNRSLAN